MSHTQRTQAILARQYRRCHLGLGAGVLAVAIAALLCGLPARVSAAVCADGWVSHSVGRGTCSHHGGVASWGYPPKTPRAVKFLWVTCNDGFTYTDVEGIWDDAAGHGVPTSPCSGIAKVYAWLEDSLWHRVQAAALGSRLPGPEEIIPTLYAICNDGSVEYHVNPRDPQTMCHGTGFRPVHILYIVCNDNYVSSPSGVTITCQDHGGRFKVVGDIPANYDVNGAGSIIFSPVQAPCVEWGPLQSGNICTITAKPEVVWKRAPAVRGGTMGETLLRSTVVSLASDGGRCRGYVQDVRGKYAVVITAGHCLKDTAHVFITYPDGTTGYGISWYTWDQVDVGIVMAAFSRLPNDSLDLFPAGGAVPPDGLERPVVSLLTSGGGEPVLSTGAVVTGPDVEWRTSIPVAPGTSGTPVFTPEGYFAGIVVGGYSPVSGAATASSVIVSGPEVFELLRQAHDYRPSAGPEEVRP
jgi:hypothetical protein